MTSATNPSTVLTPFPDHTQLPESDGIFVFAKRAEGKNWQEHPQSILTNRLDYTHPQANKS